MRTSKGKSTGKNGGIYLRVYNSIITSGILKDLKPTQFTILYAIASYMDVNRNSYPTQRQLAEITGVTLPTAQKALKGLLEYRYNGKPILSCEMVQKGRYKNTVYTVHPISQIAIFDSEIDHIQETGTSNLLV